MNLTFKPMLACSTVPAVDSINYPVLASPKLDGIRCIAGTGVAFSRNMKRIPNKYVQYKFCDLHLHGLDGELMINGGFNDVQSAIMSSDGEPDFYYAVFDLHNEPNMPFAKRYTRAMEIVDRLGSRRVRIVGHKLICNAEEMLAYWDECVSLGYEGVIVRDPEGPYKNGRSTAKQGYMSKLKKFYDEEAVIIDCKELLHNDDTSTKQLANMVPGNKLGAFVMQRKDGTTFDLGSGFDDEQRNRYWRERDKLIGKTVTYKYQELLPSGKPRFPVFKGFRSTLDV